MIIMRSSVCVLLLCGFTGCPPGIRLAPELTTTEHRLSALEDRIKAIAERHQDVVSSVHYEKQIITYLRTNVLVATAEAVVSTEEVSVLRKNEMQGGGVVEKRLYLLARLRMKQPTAEGQVQELVSASLQAAGLRASVPPGMWWKLGGPSEYGFELQVEPTK